MSIEGCQFKDSWAKSTIQKNCHKYETILHYFEMSMCCVGRTLFNDYSKNNPKRRSIYEIFGHPGQNRMYNTLKSYVHWTGMQDSVNRSVKRCHACQMEKQNKKQNAKLLPTSIDEDINPFQIIAIDLVGPMNSITEENGVEFSHILTIIDLKTRFIEMVPLSDITGKTIATTIDNNRLNRYPRPQCCLSDQGKNLVGNKVEELLTSYNIKHLYTTVYNPQTNSILERAQGTLKEHLRTSGGLSE
eukprot:NODE_272_length_11042_cov_1.328338.p1 type:complete len:245 gc:universal NODE_272_length_11042_cov_1.328338:1499-2233(+)